MNVLQASGNAVANIQDITLREPQEVADNLLLKPNVSPNIKYYIKQINICSTYV